MHELSIINALLKYIQPYLNRKIKCIKIEVGSMSCIDPERLIGCFDWVKATAGLSDTQLIIDHHPAKASCQQCHQDFSLTQLGQPCPCGSYDYTLLSGQQLTLTEIEFA
ncbi:hydrogenase maturation nickel metallochaperone HypA [Zooshikella harenae]|uniref:Hydrogenase maturation factor HypA n=1 Tax=Zooshikella harenae TaxID=2827238 RepID=A0ABS5ZE10_9GAMM|nr:hydrogenase maturation nickel metallochaperone HypA [Zooshikella harenae]MBU2712307.1 hydrogenase maturation nickel metallochaperone HypA [Zooshikella harenae]